MDIHIHIDTGIRQQALDNIMNKDKVAKAAPVTPDKKTKEDTDYREAIASKFANIDESCGTCKFAIDFQGDIPPTCENVKGTIDKKYICNLFERGSRDTTSK